MPEIAFLALSLSSHYFGIIFQYFHKHTQRHGGTGGEAYAGDITGQPGIGTHISTTFQGRLSHGGLATHPKRWESKFARHPSKLYPRKIAGARLDPSISEYLLLVTAHNGPQVGNTRRSGTVQRQSGLSVPLRAFSEHSMMVVWTESWDERGGHCLCPGLREGFKAEAFKWVCAGWVWLCEKEKGAICTRIGRGGRQSNVNEEWSHRVSWGRRRVEMVCWE